MPLLPDDGTPERIDLPEDKFEQAILELPPVFATILQLEEVNRILTASIMALLQMQALSDLDKRLHFRDNPLTTFQELKQAALNTLDNQFKQRLAAVAGPNPNDQAKYLMNHPEAILFSGERISK